jgi:hypothetical protein
MDIRCRFQVSGVGCQEHKKEGFRCQERTRFRCSAVGGSVFRVQGLTNSECGIKKGLIPNFNFSIPESLNSSIPELLTPDTRHLTPMES